MRRIAHGKRRWQQYCKQKDVGHTSMSTRRQTRILPRFRSARRTNSKPAKRCVHDAGIKAIELWPIQSHELPRLGGFTHVCTWEAPKRGGACVHATLTMSICMDQPCLLPACFLTPSLLLSLSLCVLSFWLCLCRAWCRVTASFGRFRRVISHHFCTAVSNGYTEKKEDALAGICTMRH
ncbi:hypothetical protein V8C34DRAFT_222686 [Trichoderma compactum]